MDDHQSPDDEEESPKQQISSPYNNFAKNHMFFDFGYNNTRDDDIDYLFRSIAEIDDLFQLIMVADHFDESMVLLSDLFCWPVEEFAGLSLNRKLVNRNTNENEDERIRNKVSFKSLNTTHVF